MQSNDSRFNGKFYVGVLSTGIYCLPSCKAKLPLLKNVRFFVSREEAIAFGLRGCKRCLSEKFPDTLPEWLPPVMAYLRNNYRHKLNESALMKFQPSAAILNHSIISRRLPSIGKSGSTTPDIYWRTGMII